MPSSSSGSPPVGGRSVAAEEEEGGDEGRLEEALGLSSDTGSDNTVGYTGKAFNIFYATFKTLRQIIL